MEAPLPQEPGRGGIILTLGILSLVVCALLGPFAWVMGQRDLTKMRTGRMDPSDRPLAQGGMICGIIGTVLLAGSFFVAFFWFLMVAFGLVMGGALS